MIIEKLKLTKRIENRLKRAGIFDTDQLIETTESYLSILDGIGKKALIEIKDRLAYYGLSLEEE